MWYITEDDTGFGVEFFFDFELERLYYPLNIRRGPFDTEDEAERALDELDPMPCDGEE